MNGITNGLYDGLLTGQANGLFDGLNNGLNNGLFNNDIVNDFDAQNFINAVASLNQQQQKAINYLVFNLKANNLWNKCKAIYPFVGGTASTHKFNLKNPSDTNSAFRLSFVGGWTHSLNGALPNGTNAYADTFCVPSTNLTINDNHLSFYSRTNVSEGRVDFGAQQDPGQFTLYISIRNTTNNLVISITSSDANRVIVSNTNSLGFFIGSRVSSTSLKAYKNGLLLATQTAAGLSSQSADAPVISALRYTSNAGVTSIINYSTKQVAFASIGSGLTDTESNIFNIIVQNYQTLLNRGV